jgi:hypothetical protein
MRLGAPSLVPTHFRAGFGRVRGSRVARDSVVFARDRASRRARLGYLSPDWATQCASFTIWGCDIRAIFLRPVLSSANLLPNRNPPPLTEHIWRANRSRRLVRGGQLFVRGSPAPKCEVSEAGLAFVFCPPPTEHICGDFGEEELCGRPNFCGGRLPHGSRKKAALVRGLVPSSAKGCRSVSGAG